MNKKDKLKLDVMSNIDEKTIEKVSKKRFKLARYLQKRPFWTKKWFVPSSVAALLLVCMGIFFAVLLFSKQVPVYRGMTISSVEPQTGLSNKVTFTPLSAQDFAEQALAPADGPKPPKGDVVGGPAHREDTLDTDGSAAEDAAKDSLQVEGSTAEIYYAKPNEEIYITIHIDNPDSFEILSFTLNGKKYSSYMFEPGSDMENLILKVNVGDVEGVVEYTIDAIKYVDGTEIKDVRMEGDKTVRAGVATDRQPTATLIGKSVDFYGVSFNVSINDPLELISKSQGKLYAMLYDGTGVLAINEISPDEVSQVTFEGLLPNTAYQYAVGAVYDDMTGTGTGLHVLAVKNFTTKAPVLFHNLQISTTQVNFAFLWDEAFAKKEITAITLYRGDEKIADVDSDATSLTGLLSNTAYTLVAEYRGNKDATEQIVIDFVTAEKAIPSVLLSAKDVTQTGFGFDVNVLDVDAVGAITAIELIHGNDAPIPAESLDVRAFDELLSNNDYTVRVTYTYDLNDGTGAKTLVKELSVKTLAKATPSVTLTQTDLTQTGFGFDISVTDPDAVGALTAIELLHGNDAPIPAESLDMRRFDGLLCNNDYTVRVTYTYDLCDGTGAHTIVKELIVKTLAKATPSVTLTQTDLTQTGVAFDLATADADGILRLTKLELLRGGQLISTDASCAVRRFDGLTEYTQYTVKVSYEYDLNDGNGICQTSVKHSFYTLPIFAVTNSRCLNTGGIFPTDILYLQFSVNNPASLKPISVVINGKTYPVSDISTTQNIRVTDPASALAPGENLLTLEEIVFEGADQSYTCVPLSNNTVTVFVQKELSVTSVRVVDAARNELEYLYPSTNAYFLITLDNPTGHTVESVYCYGKSVQMHYTASEITVIDNNTLMIRLKTEEWRDFAYQNFGLGKITYSNTDLDARTLEPHVKTQTVLKLDHNGTVEIRTVDDLKNMSENRHYVLMNDIDLSGVYVENFGDFKGYFDGNGHSISGYTVIKDFYDREVSLGLFATAEGIVRDLDIRDVFVLAAVSSVNGSQYSSSYGGFCARVPDHLLLKNVTHTGEVTLINNTGGVQYYGGLVGLLGGIYTEYDRSIAFENCATYGTLTNGGGFIGCIGTSYDGFITITLRFESCSNQTQISGVSQFYDAYRFIAALDKSESDILNVEFVDCRA